MAECPLISVVLYDVCLAGKIKGEELLKTAKKENLDIKEFFKVNDIEVTELKTSKKK